MNDGDQVVRRILDDLEERIDLDHVARAESRRMAALDFADSDRAPLVFHLPYEGTAFSPYPYAEAFSDPAKMMVNELLTGWTSIYHAVDLRDDAPYCLRPNLGVGLIASMFGAQVSLTQDNMPWVLPLGDERRIRELLESPLPDITAGLGARAIEQYEYFHVAMADHPACRAAIRLTLPDLQGPFSVAELLWGSDIYTAFYDDPELIRQLLDRITQQMVAVFAGLVGLTTDLHAQGFCHQHGVTYRGNLLIRADSIINISPALYRDVVMPFDRRLGQVLGGVGLHFCGNSRHQVSSLLENETLTCIDLGDPQMMDLDALYAEAAPRGVALVRLAVPPGEWDAAALRQRFPRGVLFTCKPASVAEAEATWQQYLGRRAPGI